MKNIITIVAFLAVFAAGMMLMANLDKLLPPKHYAADWWKVAMFAFLGVINALAAWESSKD